MALTVTTAVSLGLPVILRSGTATTCSAGARQSRSERWSSANNPVTHSTVAYAAHTAESATCLGKPMLPTQPELAGAKGPGEQPVNLVGTNA